MFKSSDVIERNKQSMKRFETMINTADEQLSKELVADDALDGQTTLLNAMENCRERLAALIELNIINFNQNRWDSHTIPLKLLTEMRHKHCWVFTLRWGGVRFYRCTCQTPTKQSKIQFLMKMYDILVEHGFEVQIREACIKQLARAEARKERNRLRRRKKSIIQRNRYFHILF